jgi:hypothetical protein
MTYVKLVLLFFLLVVAWSLNKAAELVVSLIRGDS